MNFIQKKLIAILLLLVITSCGFHLRGMTEISFKTISLEGKELSLTKNLKKILNTNKVAIVSSTENPELRVELLSEESEKRILSLSGQGLVREFEIFYRVRPLKFVSCQLHTCILSPPMTKTRRQPQQ